MFVAGQAEWLDQYTPFHVLLDEHHGERLDWPEEQRTFAAASAWAAALPTRRADVPPDVLPLGAERGGWNTNWLHARGSLALALPMNVDPAHRIAGVLVPIFALRAAGDLGIGDAVSLMEFVDWAAATGFRVVKILPINETGSAICSRALDLTTIRTTPEHLPDLCADGFEWIVATVDGAVLDSTKVDYAMVKVLKNALLKAAFARFCRNHFTRKTPRAEEFQMFVGSQAEWLDQYTLFHVLLDERYGERWANWPDEQRMVAAAQSRVAALQTRKADAVARQRLYYAYVQWIAFTQWRAAKARAEQRGVALIGDIPFGVSYQSADVWAKPDLFRQRGFGGTLPDSLFKHDAFVQKRGQNWGIPLYDWPAHWGTKVHWWKLCVQGVRESSDLRLIVEDAGPGSVIGKGLGEVPDYVRPNLTHLGIAGHKTPGWKRRCDGNENVPVVTTPTKEVDR